MLAAYAVDEKGARSLIAVGSSINFDIIAAQPLQIFGAVLLLVLIKTGILLLSGKLFRISAEQNFIYSFSLSQVGEFAFVLLSFALQGGILQPEKAYLNCKAGADVIVVGNAIEKNASLIKEMSDAVHSVAVKA